MELLQKLISEPVEWFRWLITYDPGNPIFFTHSEFLLFLFLFLLTILVIPRFRITILLGFSLWFYYKCSGPFISVILFAGLFNFVSAGYIARAPSPSRRRIITYLAVFVNIALLAIFKYTPYFAELLRYLTLNLSIVSALAFPIGLSFYTFANISYLLDVKKKVIEPETNPIKYLTYITFFPVVQMGPIERAVSFLPQLSQRIILNRQDVSEGLYLILSGAVKKMVIGDYINLHLVNQVLGTPERHTGMENLAAVVGYSMVIYCDFSGYTDIARGVARWMGFRIRLNFDFPYRASDIGDFWRRWHISLSTWLRDYLFLPLAFTLSRMIRQDRLFSVPFLRSDVIVFILASFVTFTICGIWHGTGWNFILWGALHGSALGIHKTWHVATRRIRKGMGPMARRGGSLLSVLLTFTFVTVSWIFFRMRSPGEAMVVLGQIGRHFYGAGWSSFLAAYYPVLLMLATGFLLHFLPVSFYDRIRVRMASQPWYILALMTMVVVAVIAWFSGIGSPQPIYIRF